jgi:hypothetical protein
MAGLLDLPVELIEPIFDKCGEVAREEFCAGVLEKLGEIAYKEWCTTLPEHGYWFPAAGATPFRSTCRYIESAILY